VGAVLTFPDVTRLVELYKPRLMRSWRKSGSPSPGPPTRSSWWKPAQTWPIPPGFRWEPIPSPAAHPISANPIGRIIPPVSTASARCEKEGGAAMPPHLSLRAERKAKSLPRNTQHWPRTAVVSKTSRSATAAMACRDTPDAAEFFKILRLVNGTQPRPNPAVLVWWLPDAGRAVAAQKRKGVSRRRAEGPNRTNHGAGTGGGRTDEAAGRDHCGRDPGLANGRPKAPNLPECSASPECVHGEEDFRTDQPPDAENRTFGSVGGCRGAIPGTRPDPVCCGRWQRPNAPLTAAEANSLARRRAARTRRRRHTRGLPGRPAGCANPPAGPVPVAAPWAVARGTCPSDPPVPTTATRCRRRR